MRSHKCQLRVYTSPPGGAIDAMSSEMKVNVIPREFDYIANNKRRKEILFGEKPSKNGYLITNTVCKHTLKK